ncbi:tRNA nucleotidyltransferase cca2 isoform X3 [Eucalyptus grandis]|uniref:tRNA nucleotidyltransferase cca2 isoform X3 n=1 Tax=Eucalyptus grandis TaxID=71139 RepID=UPI00192EB5F1|nr:tRNA nucleotidyltransferase cca2 isoform X3 [Eucalyptus grandis]
MRASFLNGNSSSLFLRSIVRSCNRLALGSVWSPLKARSLTKTAGLLSCKLMSANTPVVRVKEKIGLTEKEKMIFDRLLATVRHFDLPTQLRVAGGWVRDKLLGKDCYDIDIALDDMLGSTFVDKVTQYLASTGEEAQGLAVIPSNPNQSKHLETARMRLYDIWIDFVNLRSEKYSDNSRIPTQMDFGTAEEDAYRRDLTINSMFYNINTSLVEDLTGRGIDDLRSGKIVTPLAPKETFLDDPLRVLRAIRFGARFSFTLDEELKRAAASNDVKDALAAKISRERIGTEVDLMVSGNGPVKAIAYIYELQLFWVVFSLPHEHEPTLPEECDRMNKEGCPCMQLCFSHSEPSHMKITKIPIVNYVFRNSLKRKASDAETVVSVHSAVARLLSLIPFLESNVDGELNEDDMGIELVDIPASSKLRVLTGFLLREVKDFWRVALLIALLAYPSPIGCSEDAMFKHTELDKRKKVFQAVENAILKLGLEKIWEVKPLVTGKDIMNVLQLKCGGPLVKEWQQKLLVWQLATPAGTADECLEWMRQTHLKRIKME